MQVRNLLVAVAYSRDFQPSPWGLENDLQLEDLSERLQMNRIRKRRWLWVFSSTLDFLILTPPSQPRLAE